MVIALRVDYSFKACYNLKPKKRVHPGARAREEHFWDANLEQA